MVSSASENLVIISAVIIVLLLVLFGMCVHGYWRSTSRRFSTMSTIFFGCMGISLILELPLFIWFILSPSDIFSNSMAYGLVTVSHAIAISGFIFCVGIPICVWAGMITGTEINILELTYATPSKTVLHFTLVLTVANIFFAIFVCFLGYQYFLYVFITALVSQLLISLIWLCVGISLQRMVTNSAVGSSFNLVFSLNVVISSVFLCDLSRAVFLVVFNIYVDMQAGWFEIGSVLVPFCIGNFLLIRLMTASLKYEHRIESRLLKSSQSNSVTDVLYLALSPESLVEYAEVPGDAY
jgi:hypothetical protein